MVTINLKGERGIAMKEQVGLLGSIILVGVALMTAAPALADQIVVCQSCTSAPGGDPNLITDASGFNMFINGAAGTSLSPTLIVIAEYNGGGVAPTVTVNGGAALSLATVGTWGLTSNTFAPFNAPSPATVFSSLGLAAGGSLNFGNLNTGLTANGFAAATSFTLYAFQYDAGLTHTPIVLGVSGADLGSYVFGYGCSESPMSGTCTPGGNVSESVMTNGGLITRVPEPTSLLLLGAGFAGIGIWRKKEVNV